MFKNKFAINESRKVTSGRLTITKLYCPVPLSMQYPTICDIFYLPKFSLDTTFKEVTAQNTEKSPKKNNSKSLYPTVHGVYVHLRGWVVRNWLTAAYENLRN
jgi:hypothetical protein